MYYFPDVNADLLFKGSPPQEMKKVFSLNPNLRLTTIY